MQYLLVTLFVNQNSLIFIKNQLKISTNINTLF